MKLARTIRPRRAISLTPMVDVLMILLVFFMVTSTYLDLDMVPLAVTDDHGLSQTGAAQVQGARLMLLRIAPDGQVLHRGIPIAPASLAGEIAAHGGEEVILLPAPRAPVQALASVMDAAAEVGVRLRVLRLEAR